MKHLILFAALSVAGFASAHAQVGIGTTTPEASAQLHVSSTAKGLLIPRMTTAQRNAISSPAQGLLVYDTDNNGFWYFTVSAWVPLKTPGGWQLAGNGDTDPATHFIGTTNNSPLNFRVNNEKAGSLDADLANTFLGYHAGFANQSGYYNAAVGAAALQENTTGNYNVAVGVSALQNNTVGTNNTAIGNAVLYANTSGDNNVATGAEAMISNTTGSHNTATGVGSLFANTTGTLNVAGGSQALYQNTTGNYNTAYGTQALYSNTTTDGNTATGYRALNANATGYYNAAHGQLALSSNTTGSSNTAGGSQALRFNTTGSSNTANGYHALYNNSSGSFNTGLGYNANVSHDNLTNATAIGAHSVVSASNSLVLGGLGTNAVNVGIGVTAPVATLHVNGTEKLFGGTSRYTGQFWNGTASVDGIELATSYGDAYVGIQRTAGYGLQISKANAYDNQGLAGFFVDGANVGSITTNGTTTSYNTTSDYRLKENIHITAYGLSALMQIGVRDYNYTFDNKKVLQTGLMAQQLYTVFPQAVQVGGDDARTAPWMIDYGKLTPLLVKAVQEQQQLIEKQDETIGSQHRELESLRAQTRGLQKEVEALKQLVEERLKLLETKNRETGTH